MANLFDLTLQLAAALGVLIEGTATGGSTTTTIDTVYRVEDDDVFNLGTLWITYDAGGAGAAPQGEIATITDFVNGSHVITHSALTAAVSAGDSYAVAKKRYSLWLMKQKINEAIADLGAVESIDTSLVISANQTEYTLPTTVTDLRQVYVQTMDDADSNLWTPVHSFSVSRNATGAASTLIIPQLTVGRKIKLVSVAPHAKLRLPTDYLNEMIPPERVILEAGKRVFSWKMKRGDNSVTPFYNELSDRAKQAEADHPIIRPSRSQKLVIVR